MQLKSQEYLPGQVRKLKMAAQTHTTRRAIPSDGEYILSLFHRVQAALTASGSLQELTIPSSKSLQESLTNGHDHIFIFSSTSESGTESRIGAVTISRFAPEAGHGSYEWGIELTGRRKVWFLHSLMLEPNIQGKGLGLGFLNEALRLLEIEEGEGMVVLDCWAGNEKLRAFYRKGGFEFSGDVPQKGYEIAVFVRDIGGEGLKGTLS